VNRDMDLIRDMLMEVEKSATLNGCQVKIQWRTPEELYYNAMQARDAGLIDARFLPNSTDFHVLRLTYEGHEFLDAARSDTVWKKAKETVVKGTGTLTLEGLKIALAAVVKHALGVAAAGL
jgi:hypothetical protein